MTYPKVVMDGNGIFSGKLVSIENASGCEDLRLLAPAIDWEPPPLDMEDFSSYAYASRARPMSLPQYTAILRNVRVVAGASVVLDFRFEEIICNSASHYCGDVNISWYQKYGLDVTDRVRARCYAGKEEMVRVDRAVSLFSWENRNYAHWIFEKLASFRWILGERLPDGVKLLVEKDLPSSIVESIELLWPREHVLFVHRGMAVDVEELYYFSDSAEIWEPKAGYIYNGAEFRISPEAFGWLGSHMREEVPFNSEKRKGGYLVRPYGGNGRAVLNQAELISMLRMYDYECLEPGRMNFLDQVAYFSSLDLVVAPSGAALANLFWMRPGSAVVVLIVDLPEVLYWFWHSAAAALGIRLIYFPVQGVPQRDLPRFHWGVRVDVSGLLPWLHRKKLLPNIGQVNIDKIREESMGHDNPRPGCGIDVSVVVMSYNNAAFIDQTIESSLAQKGVSLEVIVIDDCSQDASLEVIQRYADDPRFHYSVNERNLGQIGNYNYCVRQGVGRYVAVLGSDDLLYPGHLESLCKMLDATPSAMLAYSQCNWIDQSGNLIQYAVHPGHQSTSYCGGRDEVVGLLTYDNYITPSAVVLRRSMLDDVALENGSLVRDGMMAGDWDLWLRIAGVHPDFVFMRHASVGYRVHEGQVSKEFYADARPLYEHTAILEHCLSENSTSARMRTAPLPIWHLYQKRINSYSSSDRQEVLKRADDINKRLFDELTCPILPSGPFFSVIVTAGDYPERICDILVSLQAQAYRDFEVILISNGAKVFDFLPVGFDLPLTHIRLTGDFSLSASRNAGLKHAHGHYVTFLNDDGVYLPSHLQLLADALERYPKSVVYVDAVHVEEKIEDGQRFELGRSYAPAYDAFDCDDLFIQSYIPVNSWSYPRTAVFQVGNFDTGLSALEDWDMLLRLAQKYPIHRVGQVTVEILHRIQDENASESNWRKIRNELLPVYQKLYARYPVTHSVRIQAERNRILSGQAIPEAPWGTMEWLSDRTPSASRVRTIQALLEADPNVGTLGVVVVATDMEDSRLLTDTLKSLENQHRPVDTIWVVGDECPDLKQDRKKIEILEGTSCWARRLSDRVMQGESPDFLWVLHAGDQLAPHATLTMAEYRMRQPDSLIWYVDEVVLQSGRPMPVALKSDFNADLLCCYPYIGRNLIFSNEAIRMADGLDERMADLALVDLLWRLVEQKDGSLVGHVPEVLQYSAVDLMDWASSVKVINQTADVTRAHFARIQVDAEINPQPDAGFARVDYPLVFHPLVSVIFPITKRLASLQACIEGFKKYTTYSNYEFLVIECDERDAGAAKLFLGAEDQVRLLHCPYVFDAAMAGNFSAAQARGEILLFLNSDIRFSDETRLNWLDRLLALALRPEIGMAGTRLDRSDGKVVDQCGQVLGLDDGVGAGFRGLSSDDSGYLGRLVLQQNVSALDASCLMMRKTVFNELGGFDAESFPAYHYDIDLCLRVTQAGYRLTLEPDTGLLRMVEAKHWSMEEGRRTISNDEHWVRFRARWLPLLARDPNYHPLLGKCSPGFYLSREASRLNEPSPGRPRPVVLAAHADWQGSGHYRVLHPFEAMTNASRLEGGLGIGGFDLIDAARIRPDVIVLQGAWVNEDVLMQVRSYRELNDVKIALEFDDYLPNLPTRSMFRIMAFPELIRKMHILMEHVDWLVVSTPMLALEYADYHSDIRVAMTGLCAPQWCDLSSRRRVGKKMRVGWACSSGYAVDLAVIRSVVEELQNEVEWVFLGDKLTDVSCEYHHKVSMDRYPEKLASLDLDLAVVPLKDNSYNRCKSNLNLLELGACGIPVVCTDIEAHQGDLPVIRVPNRHEDWVDAIRSHIADPDALARAGDALRSAVMKDWMLEGRLLDQWVRAWGCGS